jgi:hypothetical protein
LNQEISLVLLKHEAFIVCLKYEEGTGYMECLKNQDASTLLKLKANPTRMKTRRAEQV